MQISVNRKAYAMECNSPITIAASAILCDKERRHIQGAAKNSTKLS